MSTMILLQLKCGHRNFLKIIIIIEKKLKWRLFSGFARACNIFVALTKATKG